jgi:putative tricarboxylic transport membrane protein
MRGRAAHLGGAAAATPFRRRAAVDIPVWSNLLHGFGIVSSLQNLSWLFVGVLLGTIVGVMPGLGSLSTMAILLPITFGMDPVAAVIMLVGIHYGSSYGGSTTAILVNIPGEGSSVMTCMDGYPMAKQGRAKAALATSAIGSFFAGTIAAVLLMFLAEPISALGMKFGPPEYFAIMFLALTMVGSLSTDAPLKGLFMALIGLLLATIGIERQSGHVRFTFGLEDLADGIHFIVVAIGMFGVTVVMNESQRIRKFGFKPPRDQIRGVGLWISWPELKQSFMPYVRGSLLGFATGVLPGLGGMTATLLAYGVEKQVSRHPEQFGNGAIEGVATVEASNNAANGANLVPLMTLGIPGNASTALLLGAFIMYGLKPGPLLMETNPDFFWAVVASLYIGNVMLLILNLPLVNLFAKLLDVPEALLNGIVLALCVLGVYTREYLMTDLYLMIAFGVIGYFAEKFRYPVAPLLLGLVLGNLLEQALLRSMSVSNGDPTIFFTRPISLVIMIAALVSLAYSFKKFYLGKRTGLRMEAEASATAPVASSASGAAANRWLTADRVAAMSTLPIGIALIVVALQAPRPNIPMVIGPHVWPVCILILLIACAVPLLWRPAGETEEAALAAPASLVGEGREPSWYVRPGMAALLTVAGLVAYALLLETLGFLLCTLLLVLYQTRVIQQGHWVRNVATAVIFSVLLYFGMTQLLSVTLPAGVLGW